MSSGAAVALVDAAPGEAERLALAQQAKFFRGLGDPTRIRIMELLLQRSCSVGELVTRLDVPQSRVSSHLACLRWCGYVSSERDGRRVIYRVTDRRIRTLVECARAIVADNAERIASCTRMA